MKFFCSFFLLHLHCILFWWVLEFASFMCLWCVCTCWPPLVTYLKFSLLPVIERVKVQDWSSLRCHLPSSVQSSPSYHHVHLHISAVAMFFLHPLSSQTSETQELSPRTPHTASTGKPVVPDLKEPLEGLWEGKDTKWYCFFLWNNIWNNFKLKWYIIETFIFLWGQCSQAVFHFYYRFKWTCSPPLNSQHLTEEIMYR